MFIFPAPKNTSSEIVHGEGEEKVLPLPLTVFDLTKKRLKIFVLGKEVQI